MAILAISIDLPPAGALEISGEGSSPTDPQKTEEMQIRQKFLDLVGPYLDSLPNRPPHSQGNVSRVELLGRGVWSQFNHYLLLVHVDVGESGIDKELATKLPAGSNVTVVGTFNSLHTWLKVPSA